MWRRTWLLATVNGESAGIGLNWKVSGVKTEIYYRI